MTSIRWPWILLIAVTAVVAIGYAHTLPYAFNFDDVSSIRDNRTLDDPSDVAAIFQFRPTRYVLHQSFALNIAVTGRDPAGLRAVNLVIHLLAAGLVGIIGRELARHLGGSSPEASRGIGLAAALLFAAHPLSTQSVTYLVQRTTSLAALFELGAVAAYLGARVRSPRSALAIAAAGCALLAAFTKEIAVALPLFVLLVELALPREPGRRRILPGAWWFVAVPAVIALVSTLPATEPGLSATRFRETDDIGRMAYLLTQFEVIPRYLALVVWPFGQSLDHDVPVRSALSLATGAGATLVLSLGIGAFVVRRRLPLVAFGIAWCLIALLPESSVFPIRDVMNEHRMYLPLAGLAWAAAALLGRLRLRPRVAVTVAVVVALSAVTHVRNRVWESDLSLWSDVVAKAPAKARGHNNLGSAFLSRGRLVEAEAEFRRAIALEPRYLYARVNLGRLYGENGRLSDALIELEAAVRISPGDPVALNNLGSTYWLLGDTTSAARAYERAVASSPHAADAARNLRRLRSR